MLRDQHKIFQAIQVIRDALLAGVGFFLAYFTRFYALSESGPSLLEDTESIMMGLGVLLFFPVIAWFQGLYLSRRNVHAAREVFDVLRAMVTTLMVLILCTYLFREVRYSRLTLLFWLFYGWVLVGGIRLVSKYVLLSLRRRGFNLRHVVVVGSGGLAAIVARQTEHYTGLGLRVLGLIKANDEDSIDPRLNEVSVLGSITNLSAILKEQEAKGQSVDQVLVALPSHQFKELDATMDMLSRETVDVRLIPDVHQYITLCGSVEDFCGLPMINLQATPFDSWSRGLKRGFDVVVGLGIALATAPVMAAIALAIRLSSPGPVIFKQRRVGLDGHPFTMYKFRTMRIDSEVSGPGWTTKNDPRKTKIGTILRKLSLDELPQILNVLKGDMSLVGPRPEQPDFIEDFKKHVPRYALRHKIKAGLTGWAQVNGYRGDTSIEKRIEMDLHYIENWSLALDMRILLRTLFGGFLSKNAY